MASLAACGGRRGNAATIFIQLVVLVGALLHNLNAYSTKKLEFKLRLETRNQAKRLGQVHTGSNLYNANVAVGGALPTNSGLLVVLVQVLKIQAHLT